LQSSEDRLTPGAHAGADEQSTESTGGLRRDSQPGVDRELLDGNVRSKLTSE
jgi:hypothetical protein